ncbi:hypothetical protein [Actinokineospora diospyrosa]|uniref:Uncharacterized protein n=1 Tax=Actinokineospora diospyrosa TaxID=103728 RepID=A0ABT1IM28_9PSEU|nr:hypothetical protein [Actinokineospora diospyrosa]MCP2273698.1 hypothetical protein [Actinokineospora diospyrosa]
MTLRAWEIERAEVHLAIDSTPLLLVSGEVNETVDGSLTVSRLDESVLVFTDPTAADRVPCASPRSALIPVRR